MIQATEAVVCNGQDRHLYRNSKVADEIITMNRDHPPACPFNNDVFDPFSEENERQRGYDPTSMSTFSIKLPTMGAAGVFNQTGLTSSIVKPSLPAASRSSASRRSPQQIGFIPAQDVPDARNKCRSRAAVKVLPTPVSVPVIKRLTRPASRAPTRRSHDSR